MRLFKSAGEKLWLSVLTDVRITRVNFGEKCMGFRLGCPEKQGIREAGLGCNSFIVFIYNSFNVALTLSKHLGILIL